MGAILNPNHSLINPPPLNRAYNRDPNIKALESGFIKPGSTLGSFCSQVNPASRFYHWNMDDEEDLLMAASQ